MTDKTLERISIPDLQARMETVRKMLIVDVRTAKEIQESGAVPNAVHVPMDQIDKRINDFPKSCEIVFYCGGGGRASRAAQALWNVGHRKVSYFGLRDWKKRNLPTVKTANPM